jgi:uncharacterized protein YnzC (UPF0291/DUF896 family)
MKAAVVESVKQLNDLLAGGHNAQAQLRRTYMHIVRQKMKLTSLANAPTLKSMSHAS